ncbi:TPA: hypothetical protein RQK36_002684 [Vibrio vulnificus]|nr:hypothetical protein [Vibrio vulnificus]
MSKKRCGILTAPFGYVRLLEFGEWLGASLALRASLFPVGMKGGRLGALHRRARPRLSAS